MPINDFINELKKEYQKTKPELALDKSWENLEKKLENKSRIFFRRPRLWLYVLVILLLFGTSSTVVTLAQKALPGQALYPIKQITEPVITAISGESKKTPTPQPTVIKDEVKFEEEATRSGEREIEEEKEQDNVSENKAEETKNSQNESQDVKQPEEQNQEPYEEFKKIEEREKSEEDKQLEKKGREENKKWYEWILNKKEE